VPYSLPRRGVERALLPQLQASGRPLLAYSPLGHGRLPAWRRHPALAAVAAARGLQPAQAALAYLTARPGVVAIPKASRPEHVRANAAAGDVLLSEDELARLRAAR
jgi:diketogulonate reductase-like aldo/keto reductase